MLEGFLAFVVSISQNEPQNNRHLASVLTIYSFIATS